MKKTLAVAAVLAAFAGSAAADVTVYGSLDSGLMWQHADGADKVVMKHSMNETSKFALKGSEKISEDLTVGFKMEYAIAADTGLESEDQTAFQREVNLYFKTAYGEFGLGRTGALDASTGSYAFLGSGNTGFGGGMGPVGDNGFIFLGKGSRNDNSITYVSPKMAGVTLYAQVASGANKTSEFNHNGKRFYAVGAKYAAGAFGAGLVASLNDVGQDNVATLVTGAEDEVKAVSGYVTYDFGCAKVMAAAQHFDGAKATKPDADAPTAGLKGYGASVAVAAPVFGGTAKALVGYAEAEDIVTGAEQVRNQLAANFVYPLSKQTGLYAAAGYTNVEYKAEQTRDEVITGLVGVYHNF